MNKKIPTWLALAVIAALVIAFCCWAYFGNTIFKQQRRMKVAREFLPGITNVVYSQPEFQGVQVAVGTMKTGCFVVVGIIETEEQFSKLRATIDSTRPPLEVVYKVKVLGSK